MKGGPRRSRSLKGRACTCAQFSETSQIPACHLIDVVTKIWSWHEDLFFKVKDTSGYVGNGTYNLYYDSPEQYERQLKTNTSVDVKKKWTDKFVLAQARLESEQ